MSKLRLNCLIHSTTCTLSSAKRCSIGFALGMSNQQIADERGTSLRAVEALVKRAFEVAGIQPDTDGNPRVNAAREYMKLAGIPFGK